MERVGVARRVDVHLIDRDHPAAEDHRLQVQPPAVRQHACDAREEVAVERRPARPARNASGEQKCSNAPRLATASNGPKLSRVSSRASNRWTSSPCRLHAAACAEESVTPVPVPPRPRTKCQQRPPPAAEVEHPPAGPDPDLLGHVLVLAPLRLLEAEREIAVVLGAAEVRQLAEAEPEDAVGQRVREVDLRLVGHLRSPAAGPPGRARARARAARRRRSRPRRAAR